MITQQFDWLKPNLIDLQIGVTAVGHAKLNSNWKHKNHLNTNNCLYYIEQGQGKIDIGKQRYRPVQGQLVLLPEGELVSYSTSTDHPYQIYYCHFDASIRQHSLFKVLHINNCMNVTDRVYLVDLFDKLYKIHQQDKLFSQIQLKALMFELLYFILGLQTEPVEVQVSPSIEKWNPIMEYIEKYLPEKITIEQVAQAFNYSPKYFFRIFKEHMGMSPYQYMNKLRIEKAKRLITSTEMHMSTIAEAIGVEPNHFSNFFKKYTHFTPKDFRNMSKENHLEDKRRAN